MSRRSFARMSSCSPSRVKAFLPKVKSAARIRHRFKSDCGQFRQAGPPDCRSARKISPEVGLRGHRWRARWCPCRMAVPLAVAATPCFPRNCGRLAPFRRFFHGAETGTPDGLRSWLRSGHGASGTVGECLMGAVLRRLAGINVLAMGLRILPTIGRKWCCWRELNSRPLHYQGSALPLSYSSAGCGGDHVHRRCGRLIRRDPRAVQAQFPEKNIRGQSFFFGRDF